jgi:hypothetical protein
MPLIVAGKVTQFLIVVALLVSTLILIPRIKSGRSTPEIRRLPAMDAIDEAIGRATELGKPIVYSPGTPERIDDAQTFASLGILSHVAKQAARYECDLIVTCNGAWLHPLLDEVVKQAFIGEGKQDAYRPDMVRFLAENLSAYASGVLGIMNREGAAVNMMIGAWWAQSLIIAEGGFHTGAIQIGATAHTHQLAFFVTACDYCLIGEEIYAAGAYISRDPVLLGTLLIQDWVKLVMAVVVVLGVVLAAFDKQKMLIDLIKK